MPYLIQVLKLLAVGVGTFGVVVITNEMISPSEESTSGVTANVEQAVFVPDEPDEPTVLSNVDKEPDTQVNKVSADKLKEYKTILMDKLMDGVARGDSISDLSERIIGIIKARNGDLDSIISENNRISKNSDPDLREYILSVNDIYSAEITYSNAIADKLSKIGSIPKTWADDADNAFQWIIKADSISKEQFDNESREMDRFNKYVNDLFSEQNKIVSDFNIEVNKMTENHQKILADTKKIVDYLEDEYLQSLSDRDSYQLNPPQYIAPIVPSQIKTSSCTFTFSPVGNGGEVHCTTY